MSRYYLDAAPVTATVDGASPFSLHRTSRATVLFGLVKGPGAGKEYVVECSALGGANIAKASQWDAFIHQQKQYLARLRLAASSTRHTTRQIKFGIVKRQEKYNEIKTDPSSLSRRDDELI
ncbi:hypothetical protein C8J56DRAFT_892212 [Mycena floridula]|nr:hypothetical protein C8J56DRAFT_892212 [Mycena floridula]